MDDPEVAEAARLLARVPGIDGIEVDTLLGDMAYSDGGVSEAVEAQCVELVAKVPQVTNAGRFPKTDFIVDLQAGTVTCPAQTLRQNVSTVAQRTSRTASSR
jgi:hypothetical protein